MIGSSPENLPVLPLREDLKLMPAPPNRHGEPGWVIQDVVLNRFYRIGWFEFECLLRWGETPAQICESIATQTALNPDVAQVVAFQQFLERNQLLRSANPAKGKGDERLPWLNWNWWLHHYLFFRIPLLRPQRMLGQLAGRLDWLFSPYAAALVILAGLTGIVLVLHQWDTFTSAVVESFSAEGVLSFAAALIVAKTLHELAHALVATRLGLKVAHMGVAFVVMWPMLYTDTGESWKLPNARQRLAVASAGILCELALAGLATLGWALSDPGPWRNALLYLATTSWALSLALNASPFMRFDGYFIFSDLLDFPNLHERATAQAKVCLRRVLWGMDEAWPEPFTPRRRAALITFAYITWLYRLVLFLGIAATVYFFFFKLLGLFLFFVEITWFIMMPIGRELKYWWQHRKAMLASRRRGFWGLLVLLLILIAVPWRTEIHGNGVARAEHQLRVFAPFPARLQQVHPVGKVVADDLLVELENPDIDSQVWRSEAELQGYLARMAGLIADAAGLEQQASIRQRINVQLGETAAARSEIARLKLKAPFAGIWQDVDPDRRPGQWIGSKEPVGILFDPGHWQVDGYIKQDDVDRVRPGDPVRFYPVGVARPMHGRVLAVSRTKVRQLSHPVLASRYKGPIPVSGERNELVPNPAVFHVLIQLDTPPPALRETAGQMQIEGERRSWLVEGGLHLLAVLYRESGF
ncbi:site-2 protease family protein [Jeongeupia naejangsanensis]|uniref:HlyD family efflux transporter periplasmic adaptor subunit n=1 Tax=Jeongeupia naejangsanensis TaxID=613195 RepID=A0ABS2BMM5_9NEIS|nr:site-2 protease family protein [Jeongeupia naejangsanensis]MBM3116853.1 HlyD family efflux transporter periplasmic adaptor subunit [Jeongeupia naejangsanensis]